MSALSHRGRLILGVAALFLLTLLFYQSALGSWWLSDDPQVLIHARSETPLSVLFSSHGYRYLSSASFTPLVTLSFALDHAIAGLRPAFFYAHHLIMVGLGGALLFLLLARAGKTLTAWLGAAMFIVAPTTVVIARGLMLRHYIEGMVLALAALLCWDQAVITENKRRRSAFLALSALLYLLSMLAKEFYTPLPLLMAAIAYLRGANRGTIMRMMTWPAVSAAVYLLWRWSILGSGGGYGEIVSLPAMASLPLKIWKSAASNAPLVISASLLLLVIALVGLAAWMWRLKAFIWGSAALVFVALPLVVLASAFEDRYTFVAGAVIIASVTLGATAIPRRWIGAFVLAVLGIAAAIAGWWRQERLKLETRAMIAEGKYVWSAPKEASPLLGSSPGWYLAGLNDLRLREGREAGPRFVLSIDPLVLGELEPDRVLSSRWGTDLIEPLDAATQSEIVRQRVLRDQSLSLALRFVKRGSELSWDVGPPAHALHFVSFPYYGRFPLPGRGFRRLPEARERQYFRVRREVIGGRWTISPPLALPEGNGTVAWSSADGPR